MKSAQFALPLRLLHWLMAPALLAMLLIGVGLTTTVSSWHTTLLTLHKPLGLGLLALSIVRLALRLIYGAPARRPDAMPVMIHLAASASHVLMYACMLAMPVIGWSMLSAGGFPLPQLFGLALPAMGVPSLAHYVFLRSLHTYVGELFYLAACGHILAAATHALVLRDGVFDAIALRWKD